MNVRIHMTAEVSSQGQDDEIEVVTEGIYEERSDGTIVLTYDESDVIGAEETTTKISVEKDLVVVSRMGGVNGVLKFSEGQTHHLFYRTPFGGSMVALTTNELRKVYEDGMLVELYIDYVLEFENAFKSENSLRLKIKKI